MPSVRDGLVIAYDKRAPGRNALDRLRAVPFTPEALAGDEPDLAEVFPGWPRPAARRLRRHRRFYEIGTPSALAETDAFLSGRGATAASAGSRS